jgi:uncharacterized protein
LNQAVPSGPGISIQFEFHDELLKYATHQTGPISWFEIVPENYMGRGGYNRHVLMEVAKKFPISLHSVSLSLGSVDPLNENLIQKIKTIASELNALWYTDHLSFSSARGNEFFNLLPLPFTWEAVDHVVKRIKKVQSMMEIPFGIENPSFYAQYAGNELTEAQFLSEVLEKSDCKLLLDINNVFVNSMNYFGNADDANTQLAIEKGREFLRNIPLERMIEVHIAGHKKVKLKNEYLILDNHGANVPEPVQILLQDLNRIRSVERILLEREAEVPPFDMVVNEASQLWNLIAPEKQQKRFAEVHA